jgi:DNA-binding response OmpR family regulator
MPQLSTFPIHTKECAMSESSTGRVVVLVVEDDANIRDLLTDVLTDEGYDVVAAANGGEALGALSTLWPDLVTLDLNLPDLTGEWVLTKLREQADARKPPVVVITAKLAIAPEVRNLAEAIVPKPFQLDELLDIIHSFVPLPERDRERGAT